MLYWINFASAVSTEEILLNLILVSFFIFLIFAIRIAVLNGNDPPPLNKFSAEEYIYVPDDILGFKNKTKPIPSNTKPSVVLLIISLVLLYLLFTIGVHL